MNLPAAETAGYLKEIILCHSGLSGLIEKTVNDSLIFPG